MLNLFSQHVYKLGFLFLFGLLPSESIGVIYTWKGGDPLTPLEMADSANWNSSPPTPSFPSPGDEAIFNNTGASFPTPQSNGTTINTGEFTFPAGTSTVYTIEIINFGLLQFGTLGVSNFSLPIIQNFDINTGGEIIFQNSSAAGSNTVVDVLYTLNDGTLTFVGTSSAEYVSIAASNNSSIVFDTTSTASNATFNLNLSSVTFNDTSSGGSAAFTLNNQSLLTINQTNTIGPLNGDSTSVVDLFSNSLTETNAASATFAGTISGTGGSFTKEGVGILTLTGTNTYTGGTTISAGTLTVNANSLPPGTITDNAALIFNQVGNGAFNGNITGSGSVTKTGSGNLTLLGTSNYSGGTTILQGTLIGTTSSLQGSILDSGTLTFNQTSLGIFNFVGSIFGTGNVTTALTNIGTVNLVGTTNTYTGGTQILAGGLTVDTNSLPSAGGVLDNGVLNFNQAGTGTYSGNITGTGSLTKSGLGTLTLTGTNHYSNGTTISSGTLAGTTSSLQGNITDNATLTFNQSSPSPTTFVGSITGSGIVTTIGTATINSELPLLSKALPAKEIVAGAPYICQRRSANGFKSL